MHSKSTIVSSHQKETISNQTNKIIQSEGHMKFHIQILLNTDYKQYF